MITSIQFQQLKTAGYNLIPVYRQRLADTDTPLSVFARLKQHSNHADGGESKQWVLTLQTVIFECPPLEEKDKQGRDIEDGDVDPIRGNR